VRRFHASLLTTNKAMLALFDRLGCMHAQRDGLDVLTIDVRLPVAEHEDEALSTALRSVAEGSAAVVP
jgi:hypothetical protein